MVSVSRSIDAEGLGAFLRKLDSAIPRICWAGRDTLLTDYLRFLDYFFLVGIPILVKTHGADAGCAIQSKTVSAACYVIKWICEQNHDANAELNSVAGMSLTDKLKEYYDVHHFAVDYSEIYDWANALFENFYEAVLESEVYLSARYQSEDKMRGQAAEWLLKSLHEISEQSKFDPSRLLAMH